MTRRKYWIPKTFIALVSFIFVFISLDAHASVDYKVKEGDTLYRIAKRFKVSVKAVQNENGVSAKGLKPGMTITIPSTGKAERKKGIQQARKGRNASEGAQVTETSRNSNQPGQPEVNLYHKVKKGETLSSIARMYSVEAAELRELNNLKSARVKKGQRLLVKQQGPKTYIVKRGDTLKKIARKFKMEADDLIVLNDMKSPSVRAGQKLYLEEKAAPAAADEDARAQTKKIEEEITQILESEEFKAEDTQNRLVTLAKKMINIPYKFGGNSILGIDCSAYVKKVYGFLSVDLPRTAREQFNTGTPIEKDQLATGDLVFFRTYASFPSHVGIYLGNDLFIHASSRAKKVTIDNLETPYYMKRFIGSKRLLNEGEQEKETQI